MPLRRAPVGVDDELGVEQDARAGERGAEADQALLRRIPARLPGDRADAPVPELEQVLGRLLRAGRVHRGDACDPLGRRLARVDDDEREALASAAMRSSLADSSGSIRIAPSVVPRIRRSISDTSRSCSWSVGASTIRMSRS